MMLMAQSRPCNSFFFSRQKIGKLLSRIRRKGADWKESTYSVILGRREVEPPLIDGAAVMSFLENRIEGLKRYQLETSF